MNLNPSSPNQLVPSTLPPAQTTQVQTAVPRHSGEMALDLDVELKPAIGIKKFLGIDGGSSGAYSAINQHGVWEVHRVVRVKVGPHWLLDVEANLAILHAIAAEVGGLSNLVVAYEQSRKNPRFGTKNNFCNGRNEEFWRVLFSLLKIHWTSVDPKSWQSVCFKGIAPAKPKARAREYIRRCCPKATWLDDMNKAPREAAVDAMCIALWCRDRYRKTQAVHVEGTLATAPGVPG